MRKRLECIVRGRVHGVMYRDFTVRHAMKLCLRGFVRNESNGTVRVVAEGEEKQLQEFLKYLRRGNWFSKVERIDEAWGEVTGEFSDFRIVYELNIPIYE